MQRLRTFWRSGWTGKIVLSVAGLVGVLTTCCTALVVIALAVPRQPPTAAAPTAPAQAIDGAAEKFAPAAAPAIKIESTETPIPTNTPEPTKTATPTKLPTATATTTPTATLTPTMTPAPTATARPTARPKPTAQPKPTAAPAANPLDTHGANVYNCTDFASYREAYAVYKANLPGDPNDLDRDNDGIPCESLPGAP